MQPEVTISTATFNALPFTKNFLESLFATTKIPFNLIIVDNASTDGTREYLKQFSNKENIQVILNNTNSGYGPAHNLAFKSCYTKYFAVINNDVILPDNFIENALTTIKENPKYKQIGATETKLEPPVTNTKERFIPKIRPLISPQDFIGGAFFIVPTDLIKEIGYLFDEQFEIGFYEDVDLSWRISLLGYKIGIIENLVFQHFSNTTFDQNIEEIPNKKIIAVRNLVKFIDKWNSLIKKHIKNEMEKGTPIENIIIVKTPFGSRNFYKETEKESFEKDLKECVYSNNAKLTDLARAYAPHIFSAN